jgi:predicted PP-loop superfamily ATPase
MYSDTIQNVYTNVAVDDDIIKVLDYRMEGSDNYAGVIFDRNISVALSGGFNCGYFYDAFGMTVIKGSLTISDGTVLVKNITLAE